MLLYVSWELVASFNQSKTIGMRLCFFIKFRKNGSQNWQHATINYVDGTAANDGQVHKAVAPPSKLALMAKEPLYIAAAMAWAM